MTPAELQILQTELALPAYAATLSDHVATAKLVNTTPASVPDTGEKPSCQLFECFPISDQKIADAIPDKAAMLNRILSLPTFDANGQRMKQAVIEIFGQPSAALTAFNKLARRSGTRVEELGLGRVTESDVADALRS